MSGTVVLGIGNPLGGDDAVGGHVADIINRRRRKAGASLNSGIIAINAGPAPESYTSVIRRHHPDLLILVDAADMGLPLGALRIIAPEKIGRLSFSTHHMPLSTFMSYVQSDCGSVLLVGVQPAQTETGTYMSDPVRKSANQLADAILEGCVTGLPELD